MKKMVLLLVGFVTLAGSALCAQEIKGNWQGTLHVGKDIRIIVAVTKDDGRLGCKMYSIDQTPQPFKCDSISLDAMTVKFAVNLIGASFEGKLGADGKSIVGTWTQGTTALPATLVLATPQTAWEIPPPPAPQKLMAADADPSFDVATIKPNNSGGGRMQGLTVNGRNFATRNSSLGDLIQFAYQVQTKQIVNAPDWMDKDRYDIAAVPAEEGAPNVDQLRVMVRKLLAERFGLKFHHDKREMSAFVLTVGKTGQKLKPTQITGSLPGLGFRPGPTGPVLTVINGTTQDFTSFLQLTMFDRPVVDETGLKGKFDIAVAFTPDDSLFNGHPPPFPKIADDAEAAPNFFDALVQQTGLKLTAEKTQVDVIAIDHVEKPSAN